MRSFHSMRRVDTPILERVHHESHLPLTQQESYMKKTLATLLVAGALAAAGLSAASAISASGDTSGQGSVAAVGYWPNSTPTN